MHSGLRLNSPDCCELPEMPVLETTGVCCYVDSSLRGDSLPHKEAPFVVDRIDKAAGNDVSAIAANVRPWLVVVFDIAVAPLGGSHRL